MGLGDAIIATSLAASLKTVEHPEQRAVGTKEEGQQVLNMYKQLLRDSKPNQSPKPEPNPLSFLYPSGSEDGEEVHQIRISDEGSCPRYTEVLVPVWGAVDTNTRADISFMCGELFKMCGSSCQTLQEGI